MADRFDDLDLPEEELDALASLLAQPDVWAETNDSTEDAIVAAIAAERGVVSEAPVVPEPVEEQLADVIPISRFRRAAPAFLAGAAAAALALFAILGAFALGSGPDGIELALEATDLAPGAEANAVIDETPLGTRIILDVSGLPPAEPGMYYEAWLRIDGETGVSAGTFHLRGGDGEIELWAGVTPDEYPLFTITLQTEAQEESSGIVLLKTLIPSE